MDAHIDELERWRVRVNAIAVPNYDRARILAAEADARIAAASWDEVLPPLLGVPCTVKEIINVAGLPHTAGVLARRGITAGTTALPAARLLDSGAILLGQTNTAELASWFETENRVYGRTNNPYDPTRTAGGSSGGCAAAVACGGSPVSLGTDTGGSLRMPAFCCGVYAHKPSVGLVPQTLEYPRISGYGRRMVTIGPITRSAQDLMPVLRIIAGPDPSDPLVRQVPLGDPGSVPLSGLRVLVSESAFLSRISPELLTTRERAAAALTAAGARVEHIALPSMRRMFEATLATLSDAGAITVASILADSDVPAITIRAALRPGGPHTTPVKRLALANRLQRLMPRRRLAQAIRRGEEFAAELAETIGDGVLLHPPLPTVAPRHRRTYSRLLFFQTLAIFNLAGVPVTEVPIGFTRHGLPLGVQVVAGPRRDHVAIAVALALEQALGGWTAATLAPNWLRERHPCA